MNPEVNSYGEALEAAFDAAFEALGKSKLNSVYFPIARVLVVFNGSQKIGEATTSVQAGQLFAKAIKEYDESEGKDDSRDGSVSRT